MTNPLPWQQGPVTLDIIARDSVTKFDRRLYMPWDEQTAKNAQVLMERVNKLYHALPMNVRGPFQVTSAYRPGKYNTQAGGAPNSLHTTCQAIDLANVGNVLGQYLLEHLELLESCQLWLEHPSATTKTQHVHLQTRPPGSGRRVFWP